MIPIIDNWRAVLRRSYSVWLSVGAAVAGLIEIAAQLAPGFAPLLPAHVALTVSVVLAALVPVGRVIRQGLEDAK